jgi:hypothetical protein
MCRQLIRLFVVAAATLGLAISGMSAASAQSNESSVAMSTSINGQIIHFDPLQLTSKSATGPGQAIRFGGQIADTLQTAPAPKHASFIADPPIGAIAGYCSPGQWTRVHWYVHPFWPANYRYAVSDGVRVSWRFFSSEPPFYWEGGFTTQGSIWTPPAWYVTIEFMCSTYSPVWIAPA